MLNFYFSEKALGLVSPPHFAYDFSRKLFHMFHYLTKFQLPLLLEIYGNMCITMCVNQAVTS